MPESHDPGHGPSHRRARARPEPGAMALAWDFVSQSHEKPGQSHGFEPKPSQNITRCYSQGAVRTPSLILARSPTHIHGARALTDRLAHTPAHSHTSHVQGRCLGTAILTRNVANSQGGRRHVSSLRQCFGDVMSPTSPLASNHHVRRRCPSHWA